MAPRARAARAWWAFPVLVHRAVGEAGAFAEVPVVDLSAPQAQVAGLIGTALRRFGFFYVSSHNVSRSVLDGQFAASRDFFSLPAAEKRRLPFDAELDIGYLGPGGQALDEESGVGDTKEGLMLTNNGVLDPAFVLSPDDPLAGAKLHWPPKELVPGFEAAARRYAAAATQLTHRLNGLLFESLGLEEADRAEIASRPLTVLKMMRYAPPKASLPVDALGAGAHADWGALTILATDGQPGLQVEFEGGWLPVPPREGCLVVNAGDQIYHWTNGEYRSANHRVVVNSSKPRYSTAFFTYFDPDAVVAPLERFVTPDRPPLRPPERTVDYFRFKLAESVEAAARPPAAPTGAGTCERAA